MELEARKGVITPEQESFLAEVLDFWLKFKNPMIEKLDGPTLKLIVRAADNNGAERLPQQWKDELIPIIDAAMSKDFEKVRGLAADLLNKKIDIPNLDDYMETIVFDSFTKFVVAAITYFMQNKNQ